MMRRTLPVSMYFSLSAGSTLLWKLAQWPQVMEAYSTMVIGASALPSTRSGSGPGFISSSTGTSAGPAAFLRCANAAWDKPQAAATDTAAAPADELQEVAPGDVAEARRQGREIGHGSSSAAHDVCGVLR